MFGGGGTAFVVTIVAADGVSIFYVVSARPSLHPGFFFAPQRSHLPPAHSLVFRLAILLLMLLSMPLPSFLPTCPVLPCRSIVLKIFPVHDPGVKNHLRFPFSVLLHISSTFTCGTSLLRVCLCPCEPYKYTYPAHDLFEHPSDRNLARHSMLPRILRAGHRCHFYSPNTKMFFVKNVPLRSPYSTTNSSQSESPKTQKIPPTLPKRRRRPLRAFVLITLGALLFVSIKDYQETAAGIGEKELVRPTSWPLYLYSYLPLNTLSRLWGSFNNITLPVPLREPGFKLYSFLFGVNLDEMQDPDLTHYKNLGEFFYREIKQECRPVDPTALVVSPSDGRVLKFGKVNPDGGIEQVKGMTYKLEALLGASESQQVAHSMSLTYEDAHSDLHRNHDSDDIFLSHLRNNTNHDCTARAQDMDQQSLVTFSQQGEKSYLHPSTSHIMNASVALTPTTKETDLFYAVIYLAPGDYHRFHSPVTWVSTLRRHFVGELYSVAPYFQKAFTNLFVLNERVALLGYWKYGFFSMTPVGATNVGSIKINFDKDLVTNTTMLNGKKLKKNTCYEAHYSNASSLLKGEPLVKGQEMGGFMLGSTVVLVFEAPKDFKFTLHENQYVKMGQCIGELNN